MTRQEILEYIAKTFADLIYDLSVTASDEQTTFKYVIDEVLHWGGGKDKKEVQKCADYFALRHFYAKQIDGGTPIPDEFLGRMAEAKKACADYPFGQE